MASSGSELYIIDHVHGGSEAKQFITERKKIPVAAGIFFLFKVTLNLLHEID